MDDHLQWRITTFFNYWRQRYNFIRELDLNKHNHEANVLTWAALDALSNLWADNLGKNQCRDKRKRIRFDAFLARYGGETFQMVSLPDLWNRSDNGKLATNKIQLSQDVCNFLGVFGGRRAPTRLDENQIRHSSDDCKMDLIVADTLRQYPSTNRIELEKCLTLSRYGSIAYKQMRSSYIHEGRGGENSHEFELGESLIQPTYLWGIYTIPQLMGFSVKFMLGILINCIDEFENEAVLLQQDPVPEK